MVACKESELRILESFENDESSDFRKYIRTQIEDVKDEIRNIDRRKDHLRELTYDDITNMISPDVKDGRERITYLTEEKHTLN